jgi:hypothetical protein
MDDDRPPGIRRLCVAYGIESPRDDDGEPTEAQRSAAERRGAAAFTWVCASLGLNRMLLDDGPAGHVGLLPVGIDEPRVVSALVEGLPQALDELNVRCRLAIHEGVTTLAAGGFGGGAVAKVRRLAQSPPLRAALAEHPRACLAVLLSAPVFEAIGPELPADQFRPVDVADPGPGGPGGPRGPRGPGDIAWIFVPGRP